MLKAARVVGRSIYKSTDGGETREKLANGFPKREKKSETCRMNP
jgi:hypothetical protein